MAADEVDSYLDMFLRTCSVVLFSQNISIKFFFQDALQEALKAFKNILLTIRKNMNKQNCMLFLYLLNYWWCDQQDSKRGRGGGVLFFMFTVEASYQVLILHPAGLVEWYETWVVSMTCSFFSPCGIWRPEWNHAQLNRYC